MAHIRNIKEILNIQTGNRSTNRNMGTIGPSSFSQGASQEKSLSSMNSQQSSQEGSDPNVVSSYQSKPLLFGDLKDKYKVFGLLDKFEEDKKRAQEKTNSENLTREFQHVHESLSSIQQLIAGTERNTAVCQTALEEFASTLQNNLERTTALEEKVQKSGENIKISLECLREEQEKERTVIEEALKLLSTSVSELTAKTKPEAVVDSASQTSPEQGQQISNILQGNKLEASQLPTISNNFEHNLAEALPQNPICVPGKRKLTYRGSRRRKKRPLVLSQRSKHTVPDENSQPLLNNNKQQSITLSSHDRHDVHLENNQDSPHQSCLKPLNRETRTRPGEVVITPFCCWSQESSSPTHLEGVKAILDKLSSESATKTQAKADGFWQLFDSDTGF